MLTTQEIPLSEIPEKGCFRLPWRAVGTHGRLLSLSQGSARVHVPLPDGSGWEKLNWSRNTDVIPATEEAFKLQTMDVEHGPRANRDRSAVESPVKLVHSICEEMRGLPRKDIIAACVEQGVNISTAKTQYYHWRKKQG